MNALRLQLARDAGLVLPAAGIVCLHPSVEARLEGLGDVTVVHPMRPVHDHFETLGHTAMPSLAGAYKAAIVSLPRAKAEALTLIAEASQAAPLVVVDGQKTDGVVSILRALQSRVTVGTVISKAHGKLFWFEVGDADLSDWREAPALTPGGFWTGPGVFSADGVDPGSALLAEALPDRLGQAGADLGAGWGFLAAHVLAREGVERLHLVEAHHLALQCAEHNVTDPRARFHWADARNWSVPDALDFVVTNPPFHSGRQGQPELGQAFVKAAARLLAPRGCLWMVANRHLPYEDVLSSHFRRVEDLGGDRRYKLVCATGPKAGPKTGPKTGPQRRH